MQCGNARHLKTLLSGAALLLMLTGCKGGSDSSINQTRDSSKPEAAASTTDAQIKAVQDNPHMPQVAKDAAISAIKQHQNEGSHHKSK